MSVPKKRALPIAMNKNENEITSTIAASNMKSLSVRRSATARVNPHKLSSKAVVSRIFYATIMIFTLSFIFINFKAAIENKFADNHESMLEKGMEKAGNSVVTVVLPSVVNPRGRLERLKAIGNFVLLLCCCHYCFNLTLYRFD